MATTTTIVISTDSNNFTEIEIGSGLMQTREIEYWNGSQLQYEMNNKYCCSHSHSLGSAFSRSFRNIYQQYTQFMSHVTYKYVNDLM